MDIKLNKKQTKMIEDPSFQYSNPSFPIYQGEKS